jgi:hypothetical protein
MITVQKVNETAKMQLLQICELASSEVGAELEAEDAARVLHLVQLREALLSLACSHRPTHASASRGALELGLQQLVQQAVRSVLGGGEGAGAVRTRSYNFVTCSSSVCRQASGQGPGMGAKGQGREGEGRGWGRVKPVESDRLELKNPSNSLFTVLIFLKI